MVERVKRVERRVRLERKSKPNIVSSAPPFWQRLFGVPTFLRVKRLPTMRSCSPAFGQRSSRLILSRRCS